MPLFDFKCPQCGRQTECCVLRADHQPLCTQCGVHMVKQPSAPAFVVNGFNAANGYSKKAGE